LQILDPSLYTVEIRLPLHTWMKKNTRHLPLSEGDLRGKCGESFSGESKLLYDILVFETPDIYEAKFISYHSRGLAAAETAWA
jgi:ABC-type antimicrobial peptide transport system ATPase subunit